MQLRYYQSDLLNSVSEQWAKGLRNVLMMAPTGAGKTLPLAEAIRRHRGVSCAIAHRDNLVIQLSLTLAAQGVRHRIIASQKTQRAAAALQAHKLGRTYIDPGARCAVASAQTLVKRDELTKWCATVTLWVVDEGHHLTKGSVWGKCVERFTHPECCGLIPTATPGRADGKGLGSHHDGYADVLVALVEDGDKLAVRVAMPQESITCAPARVLMNPPPGGERFLTRYKVAIAKTHLEHYLGAVGPSGDWTPAEQKKAAAAVNMVGDVVESYKQFAAGLTAIVFARDVEEAGNIAKAYRAEGITAEVLTGETDPAVRMSIFARLESGALKIVVAVDVISEGTDIPAVGAIIFARATASLGLFLQMVGRGLRLAPGKEFCILIDHVGNVLRHRGGPDTPRTWSLSRRDKRASAARDAIPLRVCLEVDCMQPYEKHLDACPYCGAPTPEPEKRGPPEVVEGVLSLMDDETLARLRGETPKSADEYSREMYASGLPGRFAGANVKRHEERLDTLDALREAMAVWAGPRHAAGRSDREIQREFWYIFQCDVFTAQNLSREEAEKLLTRVSDAI
jgi:DNA repair protein RadD